MYNSFYRKQPEKCIDIIKENIASGKNLLRVDIFMIVLRHLVPTGNTENVKQGVIINFKL